MPGQSGMGWRTKVRCSSSASSAVIKSASYPRWLPNSGEAGSGSSPAVGKVVEIVPGIPEVLLFPRVAALVDGDLEEPVSEEELVQRRVCTVHGTLGC